MERPLGLWYHNFLERTNAKCQVIDSDLKGGLTGQDAPVSLAQDGKGGVRLIKSIVPYAFHLCFRSAYDGALIIILR